MRKTADKPEAATVLVVDDDPDLREAIVEVVAAAGLRVLEAADGATCISIVETLRPEVVVLDHRMPGRTGADIFLDLQRVDSSRPSVILVSAARELAVIAARVGADQILSKPFDSAELIAAIDAALNGQPRAEA